MKQMKTIRQMQAIMCPNCFELQDLSITHRVESNLHFFGPKELDLKYNPTFDVIHSLIGYCTCCDRETKFVVLDREIAHTIQILNRKGYITRFCCAGHHSDVFGNRSLPYIVFENVYEEKDLNLPASWKIDKEFFADMGNTDGFESQNCTRICPKNNNYNFKKQLEDLAEWAEQLEENIMYQE